MSEFWLSPTFLWDCLWQSTLILALGLLGSGVWSHRAARAHRLLVLSILAALLTPLLTQVARQQGWGVLPPVEIAVGATPMTQNALTNVTGPAGGNLPLSGPTENPAVPQSKPVLSSPEPLSLLAPASSPPDRSWTLPPWTVLAAILWGLASFAILLRFLVCLIRESRFLRHAVAGMNPEVDRAVKQAVYALQLNAFPQVYFSRQLHSPVIWCWGRRPVLYLPFSLKSTGQAEGLAGVICHELAHWKRKDHWAEGLGVLALCLMPWQPLLWWMRHRLGALSELACDEWVLACGHSGETYSEYLYQLLSQRKTALALPAIGYRNNLKQRIYRILHSSSSHPQAGWVWDCAVFVLMGLLAGTLALFHAPLALSYPKISSPSAESKIATARQFQVPEGFSVSRLSPDGKHIVCHSDNKELLILDLDTGRFEKIEEHRANWFALWSPDGKRLAYIQVKNSPSSSGQNAPMEFILVATDIETKETEILLDLKDQYLQLEDWSRDGKYIVATENSYLSKHENHVLALISMESKEITFFETSDREPQHDWGQWYGMHPRFSPRGDFISYRVNNPTKEESERYFLHIQSLDGKQHFQTEYPFSFRYPLWSPDGKYILYMGIVGREASLFAVKITEGKAVGRPFVVNPNFGLGLPLSTTPTGQFAYSTVENDVKNFAVYVGEFDPETQRGNLSPAPMCEGTRTHAWSPDSKSVIQAGDTFHAFRELSLSGHELRTLKVEGLVDHANFLCWSTDGAFLLGMGYGQGLFKMDSRSGKLDYVLPLGPESQNEYVDMAPDDRTVVLTHKNSILKTSLDTLQLEEIAKGGSANSLTVSKPAISPDGTQVAYIQNDYKNKVSSIAIASLPDGATREFARVAEKEIYFVDWSPDGRYLAYVTDEFWIAPLDGTPAFILEKPNNLYFDQYSRVQWAPDGEHLTFVAYHKNKAHYWILDNFQVSPELASQSLAVESNFELPLPLKPVSLEWVDFKDTKDIGTYSFAVLNAIFHASRYARDSETPYKLVETGLQEGEMLYTDQTYQYVDIPGEFKNLTLLQTPNDDRAVWDEKYQVILRTKKPTYVFIGVETRTWDYWKKIGKPQWMEEYAPTAYKIYSDNLEQKRLCTYYQVFARKAEPGELILGPNRSILKCTDMYIAFFGEE